METPLPALSRIKIGHHWIGIDEVCFTIADIGLNHEGDIHQLEELINLTAHAGVNGIILSLFHPEDYSSPELLLSNSEYSDTPDAEKKTLTQFLANHAIPSTWIKDIAKLAKDLGLVLLIKPGCLRCAEYAKRFRINGYVIDSMELNNLDFIKSIAELDLPILLCINMGYMSEIESAIRVILRNGNQQFAIIHSPGQISEEKEDSNLNIIPVLNNLYNVPIGFFNKSLSYAASLGSVALGARIIIKRVTLSRSHQTPDYRSAFEPSEFSNLISEIRMLEKSLGSPLKGLTKMDLALRKLLRRSLIASTNLPMGTILKEEHIKVIRPATGIEPQHLREVLGMRLTRRVLAGEPITWEDLKQK